jgi:hypothetical protein
VDIVENNSNLVRKVPPKAGNVLPLPTAKSADILANGSGFMRKPLPTAGNTLPPFTTKPANILVNGSNFIQKLLSRQLSKGLQDPQSL